MIDYINVRPKADV